MFLCVVFSTSQLFFSDMYGTVFLLLWSLLIYFFSCDKHCLLVGWTLSFELLLQLVTNKHETVLHEQFPPSNSNPGLIFFLTLFLDLILNEWVLPAFQLVDCYFFCMLTVFSLNNILNWVFLTAFFQSFHSLACVYRECSSVWFSFL